MNRLSMKYARLATGAAAGLTGAALLAYQSLVVWENIFGATQHYIVHITGVLIFAGLWVIRQGLQGDGPRWLDVSTGLLAALGAAVAGLYFFVNAETLEIMQPFVVPEALWMGVVAIAAVLLVTWRMWGAVLALICLAAALYMAFGHFLPEALASRKQPLNVSISFLSGIGGPRGILSYASLSADMIFLLLIYGGALHATRVIEMFGDLGVAIGRIARGGVAYSALTASTLIGMVTGQAVSNIALSGVMTIPAMKRDRFTPEQSAAIETMASTGSQLLPPIMGLGAFLMAVILGVSYIEIVLAGLIPGVLYLIAVIAGIYAMASFRPAPKRAPATETTPGETTDWAKLMWILPGFLVSFAVLIVLLGLRYSPSMAGFWGVALSLGLAFLRPRRYRPDLAALREGLGIGLNAAVQLAVILAAIGLVVQTLTTTGVGVSAGRLIAEAGDGNLLLTLAIGMVVCLIVGMGLPTPAAYALIAIIVVPSLIDAGLAPLTANMFGFYFAIFSALTPPVAVGVLVASRIAESFFLGTARECAKIGGVALLLPFVFVAEPSLLTPAQLSLSAVLTIASYLCATFLLAGATFGALGEPLKPQMRAGFALAGPGALLVFLGTALWPFGVAPVLVLLAWAMRQRLRRWAGHPDGADTHRVL